MGVKGSYTYDYERPMLTADCVVLDNRDRVLLIRRGGDPFKGCWALPGGFMEMDETIEHCAVRELMEETGIKVPEARLRLIGVYSTPGRDPRGRTVTVAYALRVDDVSATAGDDATETRWWPVGDLPLLAFDHAGIISDCCRNIEYTPFSQKA